MEIYRLEEYIRVMYVTAKSFPDGIREAFIVLENKLPDVYEKTFFGISKPNEEGVIVYKAGAYEANEGDGIKYGFETFILKKGSYLTETIRDWNKNTGIIGAAFGELLADSRLDPASFCIEWYKEKDVMCMVKLKE